MPQEVPPPGPVPTYAPPAWYQDPSDSGLLQYWDGYAWTPHLLQGANTGTSAPSPSTAAYPSAPPRNEAPTRDVDERAAPSASDPGTPHAEGASRLSAKTEAPEATYAWLIACCPLIWVLIDVTVYEAGSLAAQLLGYGLSLLLPLSFAALDARTLTRSGVPMSVLWGLFLLPGHLIVRTRRASSTWAIPVMWLVLTVLYAVVWMPFLIERYEDQPDRDSGWFVGGDPFADYGCSDLADDAVTMSEDEDGLYTLLKVRNPRVVEDNRETYELPNGTGESLVLLCRGTGVWDDGDVTPIRLKLSVDAGGDSWVSYEAL